MSLERLQKVVTEKARGGEGQAELIFHLDECARWPRAYEACYFVQLILKAMLVNAAAHEYAARLDHQAVLALTHHGEVPANVAEWARHFGIRSQSDGGRPLYAVRAPLFPNLAAGLPDMAALQRANAASFVAEWSSSTRLALDFSEKSLVAVDELLVSYRRNAGYPEIIAAEDLDEGRLIVQAGAYVGETLRRLAGAGSWCIGVSPRVALPVALSLEPRLDLIVDPIGKVQRVLLHSRKHGISLFVAAALRYLDARSPAALAGS